MADNCLPISHAELNNSIDLAGPGDLNYPPGFPKGFSKDDPTAGIRLSLPCTIYMECKGTCPEKYNHPCEERPAREYEDNIHIVLDDVMSDAEVELMDELRTSTRPNYLVMFLFHQVLTDNAAAIQAKITELLKKLAEDWKNDQGKRMCACWDKRSWDERSGQTINKMSVHATQDRHRTEFMRSYR
tara:strand:- start:913 stop:1470 length:558 start_codon:yes stop_codon:yes gene_type:complete